MKKIFIAIFMFLPLMSIQAQNVLTPQQQLEEAQKKLEEAKKAVEEAKQKAAEADKLKAAQEAAKKKADEEAALKAAKIQKQIEEAEAETKRLKEEAARLNAEAEKKVTTIPSTETTNQSGWVVPKETAKKPTTTEKTTANGVKLKEDPKYLAGAVTTDANGKVSFEIDIDTKGKTAAQLYDLIYGYMSDLTQDKNSIASRVALINKDEHIIANTMDEWLVFGSSFISLDRTECKYNLIANISDGHVKLTINHINYIYEEGRQTGFKAPAEEIITDKVALTKKKNDLVRIYGKFRKKTIDRKDQIFSDIAVIVK